MIYVKLDNFIVFELMMSINIDVIRNFNGKSYKLNDA